MKFMIQEGNDINHRVNQGGLIIEDSEFVLPASALNDPQSINLKQIGADIRAREEEEKARKQLEARRAELSKKYADVIQAINESDDPIETAFEKLVPNSGEADTVAGELVRAMMRLLYRDYNDGDIFYKGYGFETCGNSACYLMDKIPATYDMFKRAADEFMDGGDDNYTELLKQISDVVIDEILSKPELLGEPNEEDSREWSTDEIEDWEQLDDYYIEYPDELRQFIDNGNVTESEVEGEIESWTYNFNGRHKGDIDTDFDRNGVTFTNLDGEDYELIEERGSRWMDDYVDSLRDQYGDPYDTDDENDEDSDFDESKSLKETVLDNQAPEIKYSIEIDGDLRTDVSFDSKEEAEEWVKNWVKEYNKTNDSDYDVDDFEYYIYQDIDNVDKDELIQYLANYFEDTYRYEYTYYKRFVPDILELLFNIYDLPQYSRDSLESDVYDWAYTMCDMLENRVGSEHSDEEDEDSDFDESATPTITEKAKSGITRDSLYKYLKQFNKGNCTDEDLQELTNLLMPIIHEEEQEYGQTYDDVDDVDIGELIDAANGSLRVLGYKWLGLYDEDEDSDFDEE